MIEITRNIFSVNSTIGILRINNEFICYTLEDVCRPVGVKIPGETAIPAHESYQLKITLSERFKKPLPLIYNQPDFSVKDDLGKNWTGIRIHSGNKPADTEGCIIVGLVKKTDWVQGALDAMEKLIPLLEEPLKTNDSIPLKIINLQS